MRAASRSEAWRSPPPAEGRVELVGLGVRLGQPVDLPAGDGGNRLTEGVDAVAVDRRPEAELELDLVALGNGHVAHVVPKARHGQRLGLLPPARRPGPGGDAPDDTRVPPVADNGLAAQAHPRLEVPELPVAVGRLVEVHEVHVDLAPRQVAVELRVEVEERLLEQGEAGDPHLGR